MARLAFALAATCASTSALVAPTAAKASAALNVATTSYDPSDFSDVTNLPGILAPVEFFDPLNFAADASESELKRYREAELTHGRVAMLASVGFLVGESGATPLFGGRVAMLASVGFLVGESGATPLFRGEIDGIAINQFWKVPTAFWPVILLFIAVPETFRALRGWMEPTVPENYFVLRAGYTPGDIDFDPLGLCPEDPEEFKIMQTKELQHGRLSNLKRSQKYRNSANVEGHSSAPGFSCTYGACASASATRPPSWPSSRPPSPPPGTAALLHTGPVLSPKPRSSRETETPSFPS